MSNRFYGLFSNICTILYFRPLIIIIALSDDNRFHSDI